MLPQRKLKAALHWALSWYAAYYVAELVRKPATNEVCRYDDEQAIRKYMHLSQTNNVPVLFEHFIWVQVDVRAG